MPNWVKIAIDASNGVFWTHKPRKRCAVIAPIGGPGTNRRRPAWEYERLLLIKDKGVYADVLRSTGFSNFRNSVCTAVLNGVEMEWSGIHRTSSIIATGMKVLDLRCRAEPEPTPWQIAGCLGDGLTE